MLKAPATISRTLSAGLLCIALQLVAFCVLPDPVGFSGPGPWLPAGITLACLLARGPVLLPFATLGMLAGASIFMHPVNGSLRYVWVLLVCLLSVGAERLLWRPDLKGAAREGRVVLVSLILGLILAVVGLCFFILTQSGEGIRPGHLALALLETQILGCVLAAPAVFLLLDQGLRAFISPRVFLPEIAFQVLLLVSCAWIAAVGPSWSWPLLLAPVLWLSIRHGLASATLAATGFILALGYNAEHALEMTPLLRATLPMELLLAAAAAGLGLIFSASSEHRDNLEERLRRVHAFIDNGSTCVWQWSSDQGQSFLGSWSRLCAAPVDASRMDEQIWRGLVHPQDLQRVQELREQHKLGTLPRYEARYRLRMADGLYRFIRDTGSVVERGPDGQALRMLGMCMDYPVPEGEAGAKVFAVIGDPIFFCDIHGNVLQLNPAADALKSGAVGGRGGLSLHVVDFLTEESGMLLLRDGLPCARREDFWRGEAQLASPSRSGSRSELMVWADKTHSKEPTGYVLMVRDLSTPGTLELASDRERSALRQESLRAFAGGVVHTFNNVMMAVMGNSMLARKDLPPTAPSMHFFAQIDQALQKGSQFCQALQLSAGRLPAVAAPVDLQALVQRVASSLCQELACVDKLDLATSSDPICLEADAALLERAIGHLLRNAREAYAGAVGPLRVRIGLEELDPSTFASLAPTGAVQRGSHAYIEVSDSGLGMDPGLVSQAFDPFFTTKTGHKGLGLAEVAGIARIHGGAVRVETSPGSGWSLRLLLPMRTVKASRTVQASAPIKSWRGSGVVLVIDDDDVIRELAVSMLELLGFSPLAARDGPEGLRILETHPKSPCLILLDYSMPGMDGEAALREISRLKPTIPVVFMSGHPERDILARVGGGQVAGVLGKPFTVQKLQALLPSILDQAK